MLKLIETELGSVRNMAEHVAETCDDGFLLYLIDMAILEVKSKARSRGVYRRKPALTPCVVNANDDSRRSSS